jgi:hypothetical protein
MTVVEYLDAIKERLVTDPIVASFQIARERITAVDGHLRARLTFVDGSQLEFSEYMQRSGDSGEIKVITYSYHWADADNLLVKRWDNTPHFPDLSGFPHHIHHGAGGEVTPGRSMSIFAVLDEIAGGIA